jgi:hypothetical protein
MGSFRRDGIGPGRGHDGGRRFGRLSKVRLGGPRPAAGRVAGGDGIGFRRPAGRGPVVQQGSPRAAQPDRARPCRPARSSLPDPPSRWGGVGRRARAKPAVGGPTTVPSRRRRRNRGPQCRRPPPAGRADWPIPQGSRRCPKPARCRPTPAHLTAGERRLPVNVPGRPRRRPSPASPPKRWRPPRRPPSVPLPAALGAAANGRSGRRPSRAGRRARADGRPASPCVDGSAGGRCPRLSR